MDEENEQLRKEQAGWKAPEQHSQSVADAERFKSPFFVREATLEQTLGKLKEIDPSKRKILVYVGFHPNEGTEVLTKKYAAQWAEKFGATVVCQPTQETPHAIWEQRKPNSPSDNIPQLPANVILNQNEYAKQLTFGNNDTMVVFFHGTPLEPYNDYKRYKNEPERPKGLEVVAPSSMQLEDVVSGSENSPTKNELKIEEPDFEEHAWASSLPNGILVEYFYEGRKPEINDPYIQRLIDMSEADYKAGRQAQEKGANVGETQSLFSSENFANQLNIGPSYLTQDVLTDQDIKDFDEIVVKDFEKILGHLAALADKKL